MPNNSRQYSRLLMTPRRGYSTTQYSHLELLFAYLPLQSVAISLKYSPNSFTRDSELCISLRCISEEGYLSIVSPTVIPERRYVQ